MAERRELSTNTVKQTLRREFICSHFQSFIYSHFESFNTVQSFLRSSSYSLFGVLDELDPLVVMEAVF